MTRQQLTPLKIFSVPEPLPGNPYQALLYGAVAKAGGELLAGVPWGPAPRFEVAADRSPFVSHIHWLWLKQGFAGRILRYQRHLWRLKQLSRGPMKVVWTAHNVQAHDGGRLDRKLRESLVRGCDGIIAHTEAAKSQVELELEPSCPVQVIPHGNYLEAYPRSGISGAAARQHYGLSQELPCVLAFGQIRPYKGLLELVQRWKQDTSLAATLLIAGSPQDTGYVRQVLAAADGDSRIHILPKFIPDEEVASVFEAANWAILPYQQAATSGALILGLGLGLPAIIPQNPGLLETAGDEASEVFKEADDLMPAVRRALARDSELAGQAARKIASALDWGPIGAQTMSFFRSLFADSIEERP